MIIGTDGPAVILNARGAAWLERYASLSALRVRVRGTDSEISRQLEELHVAAMLWSSSLSLRTEEAPQREQPSGLTWLSTTQAAALLQMGPRGVQQAIARGLLPARRVGRRWQISREDVEHYRAARAA